MPEASSPPSPAPKSTCTLCKAGIVLEGTRIRACCSCRLFDTDEHAAACVKEMVDLLADVYLRDGRTVADALWVMCECP